MLAGCWVMLSVALLAEGVDRNSLKDDVNRQNEVALLAEGVDRNIELPFLLCFEKSIALLTEGAGRNRHKNMVNSYYRKARN